jgi:hypothetical protein
MSHYGKRARCAKTEIASLRSSNSQSFAIPIGIKFEGAPVRYRSALRQKVPSDPQPPQDLPLLKAAKSAFFRELQGFVEVIPREHRIDAYIVANHAV